MKNRSETKTAAIYARFSTENQNEKSIKDQIRVCKDWAKSNGFHIDQHHIYVDEATSGTANQRPGLDALVSAVKIRAFDAVLVFDSSRLAREMLFALTLRSVLEFHDVKLISVSEGFSSDESTEKLLYQVKALVNEQYVCNIRKQTRKAQEGQIARGFVAGALGYGYQLKKVGQTYTDSKGRVRADGSKPEVIEAEALIIRRIYREFVDGKSINQIVRDLNKDHVPSRYKKGWVESTVSRILRNKAFIGQYTWGRTFRAKDPSTGKMITKKRSEDQWTVKEIPEMRIIDQDLWDSVQKRLSELEAIFPQRDNHKKKDPIIDKCILTTSYLAP